jgi:hypothetical protein
MAFHVAAEFAIGWRSLWQAAQMKPWRQCVGKRDFKSTCVAQNPRETEIYIAEGAKYVANVQTTASREIHVQV